MATVEKERVTSELDALIFTIDDDAHLYTGKFELMGTWEVAQYLGIERSRIARWLDDNARGKRSIGEPVARLKSGPFWTLPQVREKARQMLNAERRSDPTASPAFTEADLDEWLEQRRQARPPKPRRP